MANETLETGVGGVRFVKSQTNERTTTVYSGTDTKGIVVTTGSDGITKAYNTTTIADSAVGSEIATANWVNKKLSKLQYNSINGIPNIKKEIEDNAVSPLKLLIDKKLDKTGGTITGTLKTSASTSITKDSNTSYIGIYGGDGVGARIILFGPEHDTQPNEFQIGCPSENGNYWLNGSPDGNLKWRGMNLATENFTLSKITELGLSNDITKLVGYDNMATKSDVDSKLSLSGGDITGNVKLIGSSRFYRKVDDNIKDNTRSESSTYHFYHVNDVNDIQASGITTLFKSDGSNWNTLFIRNKDNTETKYLGLKETSSKVITGVCPTPPSTSNTTDIATTEWVLKYSIPVGFTYIQFPGMQTPEEMGMKGTWTNVTANYAGLFFRAEGGDAGKFNDPAQTPGLPNITGTFTASDYGFKYSGAFYKSDGGNGIPNKAGGGATVGFEASRSNTIYGASTEVRPINKSIRIWQKTSYD